MGADTFGEAGPWVQGAGARLAAFSAMVADELLLSAAPVGTTAWRHQRLVLSPSSSLSSLFEGGADVRPIGATAWLGAMQVPSPGVISVEGVNLGAAHLRLGVADSFGIYGVGLGFSTYAGGGPVAAGGANCDTALHAPRDVLALVRSDNFTRLPPASSCQAHFERGRRVSGRYRLWPFGDEQAPPVAVRCEMDADGGVGWQVLEVIDPGYTCPEAIPDTGNRPDDVAWICWDDYGLLEQTWAPATAWTRARVVLDGHLAGNTHQGFADATVGEEYLDGISFTLLGSRAHLLSIAFTNGTDCPCMGGTVPAFVGDEFYCFDHPGSAGSWLESPTFATGMVRGGDCVVTGELSSVGREVVLDSPTTEALSMRLMSPSGGTASGLTTLKVLVR
jgi:hypothetical protein